LAGAQKQAMAEALAGFYAALHAIPLDEATAIGMEPKPEWPDWEVVRPVVERHLAPSVVDYARRAFAAYRALPAEEEVLGYFDGHGWNMAFDHQRGVLNGVFDFADAATGPVSRDFTYSNLTSGDLTARIVGAYVQRTGRAIDLRTVAIRTAMQSLSELTDPDAGDEDVLQPFVATVLRWHAFMQSQPALRL
jgi:aminoglycoside phosphotransferase (APT) family kinase protein